MIIVFIIIVVVFALLKIADNSSKPELVKMLEYEEKANTPQFPMIAFLVMAATVIAIYVMWCLR
jgi:hypothetical protein